jgi:hypothetical protein
MTEQLNEVGMTDEAFVAEYVAKAQVSVEDADAWVQEINGGEKPSQEMIARLTPAVMAAMGVQVATATEVPDQQEVVSESVTEAPEAIVEAE